MSTVNGFQVGSETLKYNYESLENYNTPEFSTSETYAIGDYVIYQGKLYKCIVAVTTAGSWNSSNWTLAVLSDDVSDLKDDIGELGSGLNKINDVIEMPVNISYSGQLAASGSLIIINSLPIPLTGEHTYTFTMTLAAVSDNPVYFYFRDEDTYLKSQTISAGETSKTLVYTPSNDIDIFIGVNNANRAISYTITLADNNQTNRVDLIEDSTEANETNIENIQSYIGEDLVTFNVNKYILTVDVGITADLTPVANTGDVCVSVECKKGDIFTLSGTPINNSGKRPYMWVDNNSKCHYRSPETSVFENVVIEAPADGYLAVNFNGSAPYSLHKGFVNLNATIQGLAKYVGEGAEIPLLSNTYIVTPSVGGSVSFNQASLSGCASASVSCNAGDMFTLSGTPRDNSGTRAYMWVDNNSKCVYRYDGTSVMENVIVTAPCDGTLVVNYLTSASYSVRRGVYDLNNCIVNNTKDIAEISKIKTAPVETLPDYIANELAYRPLGQPKKGYLCLVCDDGTEGLGTYTIPMLTAKNVPCTFALWSTSYRNDLEQRAFEPSVILQSAAGIQQVKDAITNLGCSVAQHGPEYWTDLTEEQLNDFFNREATRFAELGIDVSGGVYPGHCVNNRVRAICGGRFNSLRAGYRGHLSKQDMLDGIPGDVFVPYGVLTGAGSNCYSYTSFNIVDSDKTIDALKTILNNAIAKDAVMICHWHDWNFIDSDSDYLANRTKLEAFIDYAKTTSVTFCTLGQIPELSALTDVVGTLKNAIAPTENGTTSSKAYAQGAYFFHDTKFCKALTAIASGATFTLNINYTETTVAAELLATQNN